MLIHRGLGRVLGDLSCLGYDSRWTVMGAADVGAPHQRDRIWIVAHARHWGGGDKRPAQTGQESSRERPTHPNQIGGPSEQSETLANDNDQRKLQPQGFIENERRWIGNSSWWSIEPAVGRVADGVAARVDRLKAIGNGQVPLCAATAWRILNEQK